MIKKCEYCGKTFETNNKYKRYCDRDCKNRHKNRRVKKGIRRDGIEYTKVCPTCGKQFVTKVINKEYCSEKCYNASRKEYCKSYHQKHAEYYRQYCKEYFRTRICKTCGKTFQTKSNVDYCPECQNNKLYTHVCKECGKKFITSSSYILCPDCRIIRMLEKVVPILYYCECKKCGTTFVAVNKQQMFCSKNCKKAYYAQMYRLNNHEAYLKIARKYRRKRYKTDVSFRLKSITSTNIRRCITNRSDKTQPSLKYVDYTIPELKQHIESLFVKGMSWNNHGSIWHVDHIKPLASYNFYNQDGMLNLDVIREANSLSNLRPMFIKDNLSKSSWYEDKLYRKGVVVSER